MKRLFVAITLSLMAATAVPVGIIEVTIDEPTTVSGIDDSLAPEESSESPDTTCCNHDGRRGDCSGDDAGPNIPDLSFLVQYLFEGGGPPPCMIECDMNADGTVQNPVVNIVDLTYLTRHMFGGGPPPEPCP